MSKTFFTSDLHFGNANIIGYENRPCKTVEEMDTMLIGNWNSVVTDKDKVYVLGDFCFKGAKRALFYLGCLNGRIHLIRGNHDKFMRQETFKKALPGSSWAKADMRGREIVDEGWYKHMNVGDTELVLSHFPILYWDGMDDRGSIHLYGHMHSRPGMQHPHPCAYNVGVDVNNYCPVDLETIRERIKKGDNHE